MSSYKKGHLRPISWHIGLAGAQLAKDGQNELAADMLRGMKHYQNFKRSGSRPRPQSVWKKDGASLFFYNAADEKACIFLLPSLINRSYILDLCEQRSLARFLTSQGISVYLLDWGDLCEDETTRNFAIEDLKSEIIAPALESIKNKNLFAAGHCMGGTLLMDAASGKIGERLKGLIFIASPWDFHAKTHALRARSRYFYPSAKAIIDKMGYVPIDGIQAMFSTFDPQMTANKFAKFAKMDKNGDAAQLFIHVEDWINNGCALPGKIAEEVMDRWYEKNSPSGDPHNWRKPALVISSSKDRLVEYESASAIAKNMKNAEIIDPKCGHISMIAGTRAMSDIWYPMSKWIKENV